MDFWAGLTVDKSFPIIHLLVGAWLSLVERSVRDREVGGSNPLAPTNRIKNLRLPAMAAVFHLWPICGQLAQDVLLFEVGQPGCNASSSSSPARNRLLMKAWRTSVIGIQVRAEPPQSSSFLGGNQPLRCEELTEPLVVA